MKPFPLKGYVILNLAFWFYLVVQFFVLRHFLRDMEGLVFFFFLIGGGFTLVSIYDFAFDRLMARRSSSAGPTPAPSQKSSDSSLK